MAAVKCCKSSQAENTNNPMKKIKCYIGMGSNLQNPMQQISTAISELHDLPKTQFIRVSSFYKTSPLGPQNQPDFINAVAEVDTYLSPLKLLEQLQITENNHDRIRNEEHWGPRTLDLDILLYGDKIIRSKKLTVPHPGIKVRDFVLIPLAEISPNLVLPTGEDVQWLLKIIQREPLIKV
jgi:2-amino-4-hydroxy-6-hydroxymethyldihydropteridine diphosphokinase